MQCPGGPLAVRVNSPQPSAPPGGSSAGPQAAPTHGKAGGWGHPPTLEGAGHPPIYEGALACGGDEFDVRSRRNCRKSSAGRLGRLFVVVAADEVDEQRVGLAVAFETCAGDHDDQVAGVGEASLEQGRVQ